MTNNSTKSHLVNRNFSAKVALNALRNSNHELGRPLALCLIFESAENQAMAASVFELAITLDTALNIPKETLLAAIRIQWWADALSKTFNENVTLLNRLQEHFQMRCEFQQQLQDMISKFQAACHNENRNSVDGWAEAWRIVAIQLGHANASDLATKIGVNMHYKVRKNKSIGHSASINSAGINDLKRNDKGELRSWLYMAACLNLKLQNDFSDLNPRRVYLGFDDPTLVWRILGWHFFGPPR
ncbi:hypothetical protein N8500_08645 [Candidatus Puniceispirillum sp.]|nr:hypothetical protein [Candidatus Puniceispirillum sp.]